MNSIDFATVEMMERYGGSFMRALANACKYADEQNLERIKFVWRSDWDRFKGMIPNKVQRFEESQ